MLLFLVKMVLSHLEMEMFILSDGSYSWIDLAVLEESYPVQVAEFSFAARINQEPAFKWWVGKVLQKRDRMIGKFKSRYRKKNMKFGIEIPENAGEAKALDEKNGNTYWQDAIAKEMANSKMAFRLVG